MGNAFKRVFVQKFQLTLILQGFKVKVLKKGAFYYVKLKTSNFDKNEMCHTPLWSVAIHIM